VEVKGKENVKFLQKNGRFGMIEDVYFYGESRRNVSKLTRKMNPGYGT
jgi:hypothetical protein